MKKLKTLFIVIALLLIFAASLLTFNALGNKIASQRAYVRWSGGGENYAQLTRYTPVGESMGFGEIFNLRKQIDSALTQNSISSKWNDCFSLKTTAFAKGDHASASVETYAFGGDFFLFHPLFLIDGQYIDEEDMSHDRVVITKSLAWKLFGSINVAGMHIEVNGERYSVAGVVEEEQDVFDKKAHPTGECMYILYDCLYDYTEDNITCYEAVLPEPVNGFAMKLLKDIGQDDFIQNSKRFTAGRIYKVIGDYGNRSMNTLGVVYPYWENASRCCEDWLVVPLVIATLAIVFPVIYGVIWAGIGYVAARNSIRKRIAKRKMYE